MAKESEYERKEGRLVTSLTEDEELAKSHIVETFDDVNAYAESLRREAGRSSPSQNDCLRKCHPL